MTKKFTDNETAHIVKVYTDCSGYDYEGRSGVVQALAEHYKVTVFKIRAVLVLKEVYVKKEVAKTNGSQANSKVEIVSAFEAIMGVKFPSMTNMSKKDLELMWDRLMVMSEARNVNEGKKS